MKPFKIICDSACDLPKDLVAKYDIDVVSFYVSLDDQNYYKEQEKNTQDFYQELVDHPNQYPKTSMPTVEEYFNAFEQYIKKEIPVICICITSKMSGSYNGAMLAKQDILEKYPHAKIAVIDSSLITVIEGMLVLELARMRENHLSFEETIEKDIAFGPKNFGADEESAAQTVRKVLPLVGLGEEYLSRSPFELSGGQKRRVAIAGILAMDPGVLVLDEPTAGLDPQGAREMMELFVRMNEEFHKTVLLVTHDMEHVLKYCDHVIVVRNGAICRDQDVKDFFRDTAVLDELRITPPAVIRLREALNARGFHLSDELLSLPELAAAAASEVKRHE